MLNKEPSKVVVLVLFEVVGIPAVAGEQKEHFGLESVGAIV